MVYWITFVYNCEGAKHRSRFNVNLQYMLAEDIKNAVIIFLLSTTPINELRGSIPYGIFALKMNPWLALVSGILGNMTPVYFILKFLDPVMQWIFGHSSVVTRYAKRHFEKLRERHTDKFNRLGAIFLALFVAVPLPGTGAWTGALLAYLFNIPLWLAFASIGLGVIGAGILVTFFSESIRFLLF